MLDFAGTLLVPAPPVDWLRQVIGEDDPELAERLEAAGRPGGPEPQTLPAGLADDYARRDTSAALHRHVYVALLSQVVEPSLAAALYEVGCRAPGWTPYPDTAPTLRALQAAGIGVNVVSNVGFDLRALFAKHGLADPVDAFVSSCELGVMKPDPVIFQAALDRLGTTAERALMVGDNPSADAGAVALGIRTLLLPYSQPGLPHGLDAVLRLAQIESPSA